MSTFAIIITKSELDALIESKVEQKLAKLRDSIEVEKALPIELTCRAAADVLGISQTSFHLRCRTEPKYRDLKRYDGRRVYVLSRDLKKL